MPNHCGFNTLEIPSSSRVSKHFDLPIEKTAEHVWVFFSLFSPHILPAHTERFGVGLEVSEVSFEHLALIQDQNSH